MLGRFLLAVVLLLPACGDDGPAAPSPTRTTTTAPAAASLLIVSGETQEPVARATVVVGGTTYETGADGMVTTPGASVGANIDVVAEGYLDRQTLYRGPDESRIALWPRTSPTGLTPDITERLVYTGFGEDAVLGEWALARPPLGETIQVYVEPGLDDVHVVRVVEDAVAALRAALGNEVEFSIVAARPLRGVIWTIDIDPDATSSDFIAITRLTFSGAEITGARLSFRTLGYLTRDGRLLTNMMGTAFGFRDSTDRNDRMHFDWWRRGPNDFSLKEALLMRLMLQRRAGNRWPDNDRSLGRRLTPATVRYVRRPPPGATPDP